MSDQAVKKEYAFDAYCKKILKNEKNDAYREIRKLGNKETCFSELSQKEEKRLQYTDHYAPNRTNFFTAPGWCFEIEDESLVQALAELPARQRDIVLLAYILGLPDLKIALLLNVKRSTVQYRRVSALKQLQRIMEDLKHEF